MRFLRLLVAASVVLVFAAAARAETAGQILAAYGEALALRDGRIVQLHPGASIESGDQIHTGAESYVQIRFTDWGLISLRPRTDFVVDDYVYEASQGGRERAFFILLRGGVRSLTGLIGHRDHAHYRLRTPTSTIGIRGTHYSVLICRQDCLNADGTLGEDGLYGGVTEGRIAVSPYGGGALEREFGAGEFFRLVDENSVPARLFQPPSFFWDRLDPQARAASKTFAGIPWSGKTLPVANQGPSDTTAPAATGGVTGLAGPLPVSSITAPLLSPVTTLVGSTVNALAAPVTPLVGAVADSVGSVLSPVVSTVGSVVNPVLAPVASTVGSVVNPVLAPVASTVGSVANPVLAPVASTVGSVVNPVLAPVAPVLAPVAPVLAPVAPVLAPIAPVISPTAPAVTLPSVPLVSGVVGGVGSLLPKK